MKGCSKGVNFKTSANRHFAKGGPIGQMAGRRSAPPIGAQRSKAGQLNAIANQLEQSVAAAGAPVTPAPMAARRPLRAAPPIPAPLPAQMAVPVRPYKKGGAVQAGAGSGVHRMQVQEHGYAKGGAVGKPNLKTIADRQIAKHVARPAPKGHKGLKA